MKKKNLFFVVVLQLSVASSCAQGGTTVPLAWNISNDTLTISGNGKMLYYGYHSFPWHPYLDFFNYYY